MIGLIGRRSAEFEQHATGALWMHKGDAAIVCARGGLLGDARAGIAQFFDVFVDVGGAQGDVMDAAATIGEELADFAVVFATGQG